MSPTPDLGAKDEQGPHHSTIGYWKMILEEWTLNKVVMRNLNDV